MVKFGNARGGKPPQRKKVNKYRNQPCVVNGIRFPSKHEGERYEELMLMEKARMIYDLKLQVPFLLIPEYREPGSYGKRGGYKPGKVIENKAEYIADFVYRLPDGTEIVEDAKGAKTKEYILKRKLMLYNYGIRIKEV